MRASCLALLPLLLVIGCSHHPQPAPVLRTPTEPLPPDATALRRPGDSDYAARVRLELTRKQAALRECLTQAPAVDGAQDPVLSEPLYVSPRLSYFPKRSGAAPLRAFEQCVEGLVGSWIPPPPVNTYEGVWVRFLFARGDGATSTSLSPLFERDGLRASLEVLPELPPNPAYEQRVREALLERADGVQDCHESAADGLPADQTLVSSALYVSPQFAYLPRASGAPALAGFERCVLQHLGLYALPAQVGVYSAAWVRIHLQPVGAPAAASLTPLFTRGRVQALLEVSGAAPERVTSAKLESGTVPDPAREVFAYDKDQMTPPRELSGNKINYTQEALVQRVQGVMRVKCILTWMGTLQDCRILQPLPYMEENTLRALHSKRYEPVTFEGQALNVDYSFLIELQLPRSAPSATR